MERFRGIKEDKTTIWVSLNTKEELDKFKIIKEEPYDSVLKRLIKSSSLKRQEAEA
jgi:hypothetical protein